MFSRNTKPSQIVVQSLLELRNRYQRERSQLTFIIQQINNILDRYQEEKDIQQEGRVGGKYLKIIRLLFDLQILRGTNIEDILSGNMPRYIKQKLESKLTCLMDYLILYVMARRRQVSFYKLNLKVVELLYLSNNSFSLRSVKLTEIEVKFVAEFLRESRMLTSIDLSSAGISNTGVQVLAESLIKNQKLTSVDLSDNRIGEVGAQAIAEALKENRTLTSIDLSHNQTTTRIIVAIQPRIAVRLKANRTIALLVILKEKAQKEGLTLKVILQEINNILDRYEQDGLEEVIRGHVFGYRKSSLEIRYSEVINRLFDIQIRHSHVKRILSGDGRYYTETMEGDKRCSVKIITKLETKATCLMDYLILYIIAKRLQTSFYKLHSKVVELLDSSSNSYSVRSFTLTEIDVQFLARVLRENRTLTEIDLSYNQIADVGAQEIAEALSENRTLTKIALSHNQIADVGAQAIADALSKNRTLTEIDLSHNQIADVGAQEIADALSKNRTLTEIDLSHNQIADVGAQEIAEALSENRTLPKIDLSHNQIADVGAQAIAEALSKNRTLMEVDLSYSQIADVGAQAIAEALSKNRTLMDIDLSHSQIADVGAQAIADALSKNRTLVHIYLSCNSISNKGAKAIAKVLGENQRLREVSLDGNPIGNAGAQAIAEVLRENRTLTMIDLDVRGERGVQIKQEINRLLNRNKAIIEKVEVLMEQYIGYAEKGADSEAMVACFDRIIEINPMCVDAWIGKGGILLMQKHYIEAAKCIDKAEEIDPKIEIIWSLKGQLLFEQGFYEAAIKCFDKALEINPECELAESKKSSTLRALREQQKAEIVARKQQESPRSVPVPPSADAYSVSYTISYQALTFGDELGSGSYGDVYRGKWQHFDVAIKQLKTSRLAPATLESFKQEAEIMWGLRHDNIVQLYGVSVDNPGHYCLVMELMPQCSLFDVIHNDETLEWKVRYNIASDIAKGLSLLHDRGIIHQDLKSPNVLIGDGMRAKITDFGLAKVKTETSTLASTMPREQTSAGQAKPAGTLRWMAPELFKRRAQATDKSDIHSYGMILWELVSRLIPFADAANDAILTQWLSTGEQEEIPEDCPPSFAALISKCWKERTERPTADEAVTELEKIREQEAAKRPEYQIFSI
jgi:Ran GTPase-activating protein (RanGAP) involved in mRNA processing and transport